MESDIQGACHCGEVSFRVTDRPKIVLNCHCDDCRKRNGAAFSTYLIVSESALHVGSGEESLASYSVEGKGTKYFCGNCGSPIYNENARYPGLYMVFYGVIDSRGRIKPMFNIHCESMAEWTLQLERLKRFEREIER